MTKRYTDSGQKIDLSNCPYYRGVGTCESGCYSEPSCIIDEPLEGWPSQRKAEDDEDPNAGISEKFNAEIIRSATAFDSRETH